MQNVTSVVLAVKAGGLRSDQTHFAQTCLPECILIKDRADTGSDEVCLLLDYTRSDVSMSVTS